MFDRTPSADRKRTAKFKKGLGATSRELGREMDRIGVDDWRLSCDAPTKKDQPNTLYKDAERYVDDPAVVVRWSKDGQQYAVACDRYTELRDNLRAILLYIREKRKMQGRPVKTGFDEFATARLPPGNPDREKVTRRAPHEVLEVAPDASPDVVKAAARRKLANAHPDSGGDGDEYKEIARARDQLLEEVES
jgi:hypothetical protein